MEALETLKHLNFDLGAVFDNSLWGNVGPVNGRRLRLSGGLVPPWGGSGYSYGFAYTDLRQYFHFIKKYVLALRLSGGLSAPLSGGRNPMRFYLGGMPGNVKYIFMPYILDNTIESNYYAAVIMPLRGYSLGAANPDGNTRFLLSNTEARFPLVSDITFAVPFSFSIRYLMAALFFDMGAAWEDNSKFRGVERSAGGAGFTFHDIKAGAGFGLRLNLFNALVLKWDHALRLGKDHVIEDYVSLGAEF
jgi:outer membrane protein assembly factor BamA